MRVIKYRVYVCGYKVLAVIYINSDNRDGDRYNRDGGDGGLHSSRDDSDAGVCCSRSGDGDHDDGRQDLLDGGGACDRYVRTQDRCGA